MAIVRAALDPGDVASAVGARDVREIEAEPIPGSWSSLFHGFRAEMPAPERPALVQVFPYSDAAWQNAVDEAFAVDVAGWRAWWTWARDVLGRDDRSVWHIPPLVGSPDSRVRTIHVRTVEGMFPALVRPFVEWPDVLHAGLTDDHLSQLWASFRDAMARHVLPSVAERTGHSLALPAAPSGLVDHRRRILTDGRFVVPTAWRFFAPKLRGLDEARSRTPVP